MKIKAVISAFSIVFLSYVSCAQEKPLPSMTAEELFEQIANDTTVVILDVRTAGELVGNLGHIDGVINIPVEDLEQRMIEMDEYKGRFIAVICRSGNRSRKGTRLLLENGHNAKNVLGGMRAYQVLEKIE